MPSEGCDARHESGATADAQVYGEAAATQVDGCVDGGVTDANHHYVPALEQFRRFAVVTGKRLSLYMT